MILAGLPQDVDYQYAAALQVERFLPKPVDWEEYQALGEDLATWWQIRASSPLCKKGGQSGDRERESPCVTVPRYPGAADD
jgi:hypothetical protein